LIQRLNHSAACSFSRLVIQPLPLLSFRSAAEESALIAATNADLSASLRDDKQPCYQMTNKLRYEMTNKLRYQMTKKFAASSQRSICDTASHTASQPAG
jgi:hypothetical protein